MGTSYIGQGAFLGFAGGTITGCVGTSAGSIGAHCIGYQPLEQEAFTMVIGAGSIGGGITGTVGGIVAGALLPLEVQKHGGNIGHPISTRDS